jgi:hypothetical protein
LEVATTPGISIVSPLQNKRDLSMGQTFTKAQCLLSRVLVSIDVIEGKETSSNGLSHSMICKCMMSLLERRMWYGAADGDGLVVTKHVGLIS